MKKQRLVLYVEPRTLMVIEQLAAMEDSSVSAFAAAYLDRTTKNNDENRVLLGMMPELKNELRRGINSAMAQHRRLLVRTAVEATVARAMVVHLMGLTIGEEAAFDLSEQAFTIAERSLKKPLEGFERLVEVIDQAEAESVGDPGVGEAYRSGSSNTNGTCQEKS
jgi:hypothetical protein